jgi:hypothetical protein
MNNADTLREFGRLRYIEPTNIWLNREGTYSDSINFPYEDYNMAVDLTIRQTNRYSCGFWDKDGSLTEYKYSSGNGTISFLGGTRGYSSLANEDDSYLTTKYTDISMVSPETNTSECLGIESISITYNSWMYPQVVIKFVDVRGATVMLPSEKGYYNQGDMGNASAIYKSLFSFPYPMFILKVKGFYGKGVTYKLAVHKVGLEFDSNSGNFNITAEFIGYMFGIYSEMPITFLAAAPYMEKGKEYWQRKIESGEFTFRDGNGGNGTPMLTFPELRLRLAQAAQNEMSISAAAEGVQIANTFDERREMILSLKDLFPFNDWYCPENINYVYKVYKTSEESEAFIDALSGYVETVKAYDDVYGTHYLDTMDSLKQIIEITENEFGGDKYKMLEYLGRLHFVSSRGDDGQNEYNLVENEEKFLGAIKSFIGAKTYNTNPKDVYDKCVKPYQNVRTYIDNERGRLTDFYLLVLPKGGDAFNPDLFLEKVRKEEEEISRQKREQIEYYKAKEDGIIEKVLGFKPSIKNIYDLVFAHMDTFVHCFYESTRKIKSQLESDKTKRAKSHYNINDGETDTENEKIKTSNGSVENTNSRCKYLPPYAAYYDFVTEGTTNKIVLKWLEDVHSGRDLEEVNFIIDLLTAAEMYFEKSDSVDKQIELMSSSGSNRVDTTFTNGSPSFDISEFIPLTTFDFIYKDKIGNPYRYIASKAYNGDKSVEGEILTTFALRAFYYLSVNAGEWGSDSKEAYTFGLIEAINVFKSVRDRYSDGFVNFIKAYADDKNDWVDRNLFIDSIGGAADTELAKTWLTNAPNLNNRLFSSIDSNYMTYTYHKGFSFEEGDCDKNENYQVKDKPYTAYPNKNYVMLPLYANSFNSLQDYYIYDKDMFTNRNLIPTEYDDVIYGEDSDVSTFVLYDGVRDYIKNIYISLEDEIKKSKEEIKKINAEYGNRDNSSYGDISRSSSMLKEYKNNIESEFTDNTYVLKTITDCKGEEYKSGEVCKRISEGSYDSLKNLWIKYPSIDFSNKKGEEDSIFNHQIYKQQTDIKAKAYLFIQSIPIKGRKNGIDERSKNGLSLKAKLLREGAYYWYEDNSEMVNFEPIILESGERLEYKKPLSGETLIATYDNVFSNLFDSTKEYATTRIISMADKDKSYVKWERPEGYTASRKKVLKKYFEDWATSVDQESGFAANEARLCNMKLYAKSLKKNKKANSLDENDFMDESTRSYKNGLDIVFLAAGEKQTEEAFEARKLQDFLRNLFFGVSTTLELYSGISDNKINGQNGLMAIKKNHFKNAMKGFMKGLSDIYGKTATDLNENKSEYNRKMAEAEAKNPFNSKDLKLSTYMAVKSLYDKWLCSPHNGPEKTWALTRIPDSGSDFDNFKYSDNFYNDIGYKLIVNISKVSNWISSCMPTSNMNTTEGIMGYTGKTLYEFLTGVAEDSGGILMALPQTFGLSTARQVKEMFTPISIKNDWDVDSSSFIFMYTYKPSEHLGDSSTSEIDMNGWSPNGDVLDLTDDEIVGRVLENTKESYVMPAFGVTYGKQNQSIFKNIRLSNATQGVTEAGIAATMNIAAKASESPRESTLYGQDLYRVFSNYSYRCSVETMGNVQIMPLMYFQLNNIPLWKGAYMIVKVSHEITAGNISTTFEGVRQNRYAIPLADGAVIIEKQTGDETDDKSITNIVGGDNNPTRGEGGQVEKSVNDTKANSETQITDTIDFDENNITEKKPLICLTPAHGPKRKSLEWEWSSLVVNEMVKLLVDEKYSDGTPYNVQRCNKDGNHTTEKGYSMVETQQLIKKYGSKCVISVVPHWNGCAGNRFEALMGGEEDYTRPDSIKLMECIVEEARQVKERAANHEDAFSMMPEEAMDGTVKVVHFPPRKKDGVISYKSSDGATMLNCACALIENWYADYPNTEEWEKLTIDEQKKNKTYMSSWLFSPQGVDTIARLNANGIKRYIDSLS